jgi:hypothetical protein
MVDNGVISCACGGITATITREGWLDSMCTCCGTFVETNKIPEQGHKLYGIEGSIEEKPKDDNKTITQLAQWLTGESMVPIGASMVGVPGRGGKKVMCPQRRLKAAGMVDLWPECKVINSLTRPEQRTLAANCFVIKAEGKPCFCER